MVCNEGILAVLSYAEPVGLESDGRMSYRCTGAESSVINLARSLELAHREVRAQSLRARVIRVLQMLRVNTGPMGRIADAIAL